MGLSLEKGLGPVRTGPVLVMQGCCVHDRALLDPQSAQFAIVAGALVTAVYVVGLLVRRKPRILNMGLDSAAVLSIYIACLGGLYVLR